jgi:predicted HTH domain antitoxin
MNTIKKITAGFFLTIGLAILLLGIIDLTNPNTPQKSKDGALAAMVLFGLPSTTLGTWIIWSLRQKHQYKIKQLNLEKEQLLLNLIQQNEGEITVTRFALVAQIPIAEAKAYLDEKAKQLNADFEASDEGGMIYKFPQ